MPAPRAKALDVSDLRASHQGMVPHTPNSVPGPWPVYHRESDNSAEEPGYAAAHYQPYSLNPGYGLPSPRVVCLCAATLHTLSLQVIQACLLRTSLHVARHACTSQGRTSSPWPDVMMSPASEAVQSFAAVSADRRTNSFLVHPPASAHAHLAPSPLLQESSSASAAPEEPRLNLQHSANVYGSQQDVIKHMAASG